MGEIDAYALEQFDKVEEAMRNGLAVIDESLEETVAIMREARQNVGSLAIAHPYSVLCAPTSHSRAITA